MLKDLKRSGLTDGDATKLGLKVLTQKQTDDLTGFSVSSYLITYPDINNKNTDFWCVRYLEDVTGPFGSIRKKPPRYSQPVNTLPRFYFPRNVPAPWVDIAKDPAVGIIITEGEKKAAKACKEGIPCISVGGVWAWRSKKHGIPAIKDFDLIDWKERDVRLCFDNDLMINPLVIGALNALSHELLKRGAVVYIVHLPKGKKTKGLDDYLVQRSAKSFLKLKNEPYAESAELWRFNQDICYIRKLKAFYSFSLKLLFKTETELLTAYKRLSYQVPKPNGEGFTTKYTAAEWCKWPQRQEYGNLVFVPDGEQVIDGNINTWEGWPVTPKKGSVKPFYDLLKFVFASEPKLMDWFEQWAAYPLQHPGAKVLNAVLLHSRAQGVGKSFIGLILRDIYGPKNSTTIEQDQLHSPFNPWAASKQFILGEEITGSNSRRNADRIKNMITRETVSINTKNQPEYVIADCANYLLTSNHVDALFIDEHDRRFVVHEVKSNAKPRAFYRTIDKWRKNGGASYLLDHLLNNVDTSDFDPCAPAPWTEAKRTMINLSKSDLDIFASELKINPDEILKHQNISLVRDLFTVKEIIPVVTGNNRHNRPPTAIAVSKALHRVGIRSQQINTFQGTKTLFPLRNTDKWDRRAGKLWAEHYEKHIRQVKYRK